MITAAPHIANVKYAIRNIAAVAARLESQGRRIFYCNVGDPLKFDHATPAHMIGAVEKAMADGHNGYEPSAGIASAREAVAAVANSNGMKRVTPDHVVITSGSSEAIDLTLSAMLSPGDEVLLPSPGYPLYNAIAARLQANAVSYYPDEDRGWAIDPDELASHVTKRTRALVLCNPNNPTGAVQDRKAIEGILEVARRNQLLLLADEIYAELLFDGAHTYAGALADDIPVVMFSGLSKAYLACGWRVGWAVFVNPSETDEVEVAVRRLADARLSSAGPFQYAVAPALHGPKDHIAAFMRKLRVRRDLAVKALEGIPGVSLTVPQAAFYLMPRLQLPQVIDDERFVLDLLEATGVLFVHGSGFGEKPGTQHFRAVFLAPETTLRPAFEALNNFVRSRYV